MSDEIDRRRDEERDWERRRENLKSMADRYLADAQSQDVHAMREVGQGSPPLPGSEPAHDPLVRQRELIAAILTGVPGDQLFLDRLEPEILAHLRSVLSDPGMTPDQRASFVLSWAIAGAERTLSRPGTSTPAWYQVKLDQLKRQQAELGELQRAILQMLMRGPGDG